MAPVVAFLDSLGTPAARLLERAGIPPALLEGGEALVPLHLVHRFAEIAARSTGIVNIGTVVGQQTCAYDLGAFGKLLSRAVTVYDYLQIGSRLIGAVTSGEKFWLTREGDLARFHHFQPGRAGLGRCQSDLYAIVVTVSMLRSFLGPAWAPREVCLLATAPEMVGDGAVFGQADVRLNQSHSSFTMPLSVLQRAIPAAARHQTVSAGSIEGLNPAMPDNFLDGVEAVIASLLTADGLGIDLVAEAAGTSTRTLQRRLQSFGDSYSAVVERTRMRMASEWLAGSAMPVAEIASMLGYRDPAHFSRAFRRRCGASPQQYRHRSR